MDEQSDSLGTLEERIRQAIELVSRLRRERDAALAEVEALRAERQQVRSRIEKLLAQIDALSAS